MNLSEYEDCSISQFPVLGVSEGGGMLSFHLGSKHPDCLAKDVCIPASAGSGNANGGCC